MAKKTILLLWLLTIVPLVAFGADPPSETDAGWHRHPLTIVALSALAAAVLGTLFQHLYWRKQLQLTWEKELRDLQHNRKSQALERFVTAHHKLVEAIALRVSGHTPLPHFMSQRTEFTLAKSFLVMAFHNDADIQRAVSESFEHSILHIDPDKVDESALESGIKGSTEFTKETSLIAWKNILRDYQIVNITEEQSRTQEFA